MKIEPICIALMFSVASSAAADDGKAKAQLARKMFSAFQCSMFAEIAKKDGETQRLFEIGVDAGRTFLGALRKNEIPEDALRTHVPLMGVAMLLNGPSDDFIIGRIYENASREAYNKIIPDGESISEEVKKLKAVSTYTSANCELIN